jgi:hypothetical protein
MKDIKDLVFTSRDCGRTIKSSKHEYVWEFTVDDQKVMIQYFISRVSLKRKILYNKKVISREYCSDNYYSHEFNIDGHNYKVSETYNFSDLLIDGVSFDHLYTLQKNSNEFSKEQRPTTYYVKTENYQIEDKSRIQRSNEINLRKKENKDEKILNFSFKANNLRSNNNNNLRKFKFNDKEKHLNLETNNNNKTFVIPSKNNYNNCNTVQNSNKKINLIDFDDDSFENNNNKQDNNKNDFNFQKNTCNQNNNLIDANDFNNQIFDIRNNNNLNNNTNYYNNNNNNTNNQNNNNFNLLDLNIFNNNNSMMNNNNSNNNNNMNNNRNINFNNYNNNIQNNNNISNNNSKNFNNNDNLNNLVDYFN